MPGKFSLPEGGILELIKRHYSSTHYERSEKTLEREQWLIPGVLRFNRFFLMPAAVIIQVCILWFLWVGVLGRGVSFGGPGTLGIFGS